MESRRRIDLHLQVGSGEYFPGVHTYDERDDTIKTYQELEAEQEEYEDDEDEEDEETPPLGRYCPLSSRVPKFPLNSRSGFSESDIRDTKRDTKDRRNDFWRDFSEGYLGQSCRITFNSFSRRIRQFRFLPRTH